MQTIGMIGGMSWESTAVYYLILNREVQKRLGGMHSAKVLLYSVDFAEIAALQDAGRWRQADERMVTAAISLEKIGADFLVICCNTMHCSTSAIESAVHIPLLHIADPLGAAIRKSGLSRPALLGSRHTMERDEIIRRHLRERYCLSVLTPQGGDAELVDRVVCEELVRGQFLDGSRRAYAQIIARLVGEGADSVIMGCTEIPLLLKPQDSAVPMFDTTALHAMAAVDFTLGQS
ncbi:MAG TPA: aspartate/glutamate racemase family protein [Rhizomicrobium sp.]